MHPLAIGCYVIVLSRVRSTSRLPFLARCAIAADRHVHHNRSADWLTGFDLPEALTAEPPRAQVKWNFAAIFVVDQSGTPVGRFSARELPQAGAAIKSLLK